MFSQFLLRTLRLASFRKSAPFRHAGKPHSRRLRRPFLQSLEDRCLLAAGAADPTFGDILSTPGYVLTPGTAGGGDLLIDASDGGLIVVNPVEISRYDANGTHQWTAPRGQIAEGVGFAGAALDAAGGILVAGNVPDESYAASGVPGGIVRLSGFDQSSQDFAVWRYNAEDGTLDTTFGGGDGVATVDFPSYYPGSRWSGNSWVPILAYTSNDYASAITIDGAGHIIVTGTSSTRDTHTLVRFEIGPAGTPVLVPTLTFGTSGIAVARLNMDGTPDTSFGEDVLPDGVRDGTVLTYLAADDPTFWSPNFGSATGVAVDGADRILVAATAYTPATNSSDFGLLRYTATGELDLTFGGGDGFVSVNFVDSDFYNGVSQDDVLGMAVDSQERIVVLGSSRYDSAEGQELESFVLARYINNTGDLDGTFGVGGKATITTDTRDAQALYELAIDPANRIVAVGYKTVGYYEDGISPRWGSLLTRTNSDGSLDESFGSAGLVTVNFPPSNDDLGYAVAIDREGQLVVSGDSWVLDGDSYQYDAFLARYLDPDPDGDGIESAVDTLLPLTFSSDFSDGVSTGTITSRGDQFITIVDAPNSADGVLISASGLEGAAPAIIDVPNGTFYLTAGDQLLYTHGSVIVQVVAGPVEMLFTSIIGQTGTTTLVAGDGVTFKPQSFTFIAPTTNNEPVVVVSNGNELTIEPGQTVQPVQIEVKLGGSNTFNLASNGVIALAIFSTSAFDASQVRVGSVLFAGAHAVHSSLVDVDGDGRLDLVLHYRTQDTNLQSLYQQLLADDVNDDGVLDSNHQTARVSLTGQTEDDVFIEGFDDLDLFLSGKKLRSLLDELAAAGAI